jgi:ParB-like partition proteins
VLELSLIENLQRADLNPIEEAQGYARLANEFGMRQEDIALKVGRSRAAVANALRLLDLHPQAQAWLAQDLLSVGHAKVVLALKAPEEQLLAAETVLRRNATVRATERLVARLLGVGRSRRKSRRAGSEPGIRPTSVEDLQNRLQEHLATHVTIHHGDKRGRIEIEYYGNDDLQRIVTALGLPQLDSGVLEYWSDGRNGFTPDNTPLLPCFITADCLPLDHSAGYVTRSADKNLGRTFG